MEKLFKFFLKEEKQSISQGMQKFRNPKRALRKFRDPKRALRKFRKGCKKFANQFCLAKSNAKFERGCEFISQLPNPFRNLVNAKSLSGKANGLCANSNSHLNLYISTWRPRYLIIGHLFILLYCHIILVEIVLCFDALYSGIGCITWSYFILYFLRLIYRHHIFCYT